MVAHSDLGAFIRLGPCDTPARRWLRQAPHEHRALTEEHDRLQHATPATLTRDQQQVITAADLPRVCHATSTTDADLKQIIRSVIDEITVHIRGRTELVDLTLTWAAATPPRTELPITADPLYAIFKRHQKGVNRPGARHVPLIAILPIDEWKWRP